MGNGKIILAINNGTK